MTTFDLMRRSEPLRAPAKNIFSSHTTTSHGTALSKGTAKGTEEIPLVATSAKIGIGILALARCIRYSLRYQVMVKYVGKVPQVAILLEVQNLGVPSKPPKKATNSSVPSRETSFSSPNEMQTLAYG